MSNKVDVFLFHSRLYITRHCVKGKKKERKTPPPCEKRGFEFVATPGELGARGLAGFNSTLAPLIPFFDSFDFVLILFKLAQYDARFAR